MNYLGISCGFHDAAISVINDHGDILFAGHSERYSKLKHDENLSPALIEDALSFVDDDFELHYYEKPLIKVLRQIKAGQTLGPFFTKNIIGSDNYNLLKNKKVHTHMHHLSHAAAGFQTSPYNDATVVIIDAIGELDTITIWDARYDEYGKAKYTKLFSKRYPDSIGLFYSAMTKKVGLKPLDEEYILMGMAAYGTPKYYDDIDTELFDNISDIELKHNLHIGTPDSFLPDADQMDIAASSQKDSGISYH